MDSPGSPPSTGPVSVVMPAYNEEGAIEAAVRDVALQILDRMPGAELIVIDDGSRDGTGAILDRLAAEDRRVRVVHQPNGGHGAALRRGMEQAGGDYLLLIDSDRQIPIESFDTLWQAAQGRDAAIGVRAQRHDPPFRLWLTRQIRRSLRVLFGVSLRDANVPFKVVRRSAWLAARPYIPEGTLAPSLFLAVFLKAKGMDVVEVDVPHLERQTGVASIRRWKLLKFCGRAFRQLLAFRRRLRAS
jgi:glycosyltransferase involved in cell wall biosynthesis